MATPLRVLLIEDSERDGALLKLHLRRAGYDADVHRVETRAELDEQLQAGPWDVAISDFNLPGFNAFDAMTVVRASQRDLPFIVLTGEVDPSVIDGITAAGSRYVCKFQMVEVLPVIAELIRDRA